MARRHYGYAYHNNFANRDDYAPQDAHRRYSADRYDQDRCKPITSRVGAGRRARITVETGGSHATVLEDARKEQAGRRQLEMMQERERYERAKSHARRSNDVVFGRRPSSVQRPSPRRYSPPPPGRPRPPSPRRHSHELVPNEDEAEIIIPISGAYSQASPAYAPASPVAWSAHTYGGDDGDDGDYGFKLPAKPQAVTYDYVEEVDFPFDANSKDDSHKPLHASKSKFSGPVTEVPIAQSRWIGSAYDRGDLNAGISVSVATPSQSEKGKDPLLRWYHLERSMMSFEEFIAASQSVLRISEQKRRDVNKLLRDVQRKFEKQRQHGRDLEPDCVSDLYVGDSSTKQSACVAFLAFPYFCLEPYNAAQFKNLTSGTPMDPLRPLLQAHFHSTSQKRELAQAITKFPNTGDGNCLHLSQVWCLIVDGDTMITCSRQSHDTLCDPGITKLVVPASDESAKIRVSFSNDRSWLIPVDDETTWPAFLSVFGESLAGLEADGLAADFKLNGETVNAEQWSFLVRAAQTGSVGLDLEQAMLQSDRRTQLPDMLPSAGAGGLFDSASAADDTLAPTRENTNPNGQGQSVGVVEAPTMDEDKDCLQLFKYSSEPTLESLAEALDSVLKTNNREKEKAAYERGEGTKMSAITHFMQINSDSSQSNNLKVLRLATYLYRFFWPFSLDHPLANKYWGAIQQILQQDSQTPRTTNLDGVLADLTDTVVPMLKSLTLEFSTSPQDLEPLPDAYSKAFLHLIMVFVLISQTSSRRSFGVNNSTIHAHIRGLKDELGKGKREITTRLRTQVQIPDLEELEICSNTSLLALILNQVSQDVMHGKPDVASTYNDYFYQLDFRITEDPKPRSHQESLRFFLQEVEAILSTLKYQSSVVEAFEQSLRQQQQQSSSSGGDNFLLAYALGESRQQIVIDNCKARIAARIDKFRGLQQRAEDLGEWHRNEMEANKDRQENAIMVFTVVTIIFLPLSYVSSVFGMNSSDVRDMSYGQWAYWAASIPLTVLVVVGSLWWAGEFEGFGSWVHRTLSRGSSASGYHRIPEPVTYGDRRAERVGLANASPLVMGEPYMGQDPPTARRRTTYPRKRYR